MKTMIVIFAIGLISFLPGANDPETIVSGNYIGQTINTELDSELARYYFRKMTGKSFSDPYNESLLAQAMSKLEEDPINQRDMAYLSNNISTDFATLFFSMEMYSRQKNHSAHKAYLNYLDELRKGKQLEILQGNTKDYLYVFVPGLFYKRHPETGGDFAAQRKLLSEMGLTTHLIKTDEVGLVKDNAKIIADEIISLSKTNSNLILISASKGGPDVAYALGKLLTANQSKNVKAWVSIGGVLRGSAVADDYLSGFKKLYARIALFFAGGNIALVKDLSSEVGKQRYNELKFPDELLIIHFIGAPLSGQVTKEVKDNYDKLRKLGPNDGLTTLVDELIPQGIVITELGLDHYYKDPEIDKKAVALTYTAMDLLSQETKSSSQ